MFLRRNFLAICSYFVTSNFPVFNCLSIADCIIWFCHVPKEKSLCVYMKYMYPMMTFAKPTK